MAVSISELIAKKDDLSAKRKALYDLETSLGTFTVRAPGKSLMLEAWDLGIGSCWVNFFPVTKTADAFQLELNEVPLLLLPIGYVAAGAKAAPQHAQRRSNDELVRVL